MRITVKLDAFDHVDSAAYAILWLDRETHRWSREGHDAIDLPEWGTLQSSPSGARLCGPHDTRAIFVLKQLHINAFAPQERAATPESGAEGARGQAEYYANEDSSAELGHWHVQCVDRETIQAEHEIFSDEQDAERPDRDA